ncbi:MAG: hypothetical protein ACJA2N_000602 [Salibacteraceae bacterium]|jgi:hypothetical protein
MENIFILSGNFYPENTPRAFRTYELAREFARLGHEVTVFIPFTEGVNYDEIASNCNCKIERLADQYSGFFPLKSENKLLSSFFRIINFILLQLFNYPESLLISKSFKAVKRNIKDKTLLISVAVPHSIHWGVGLYYKFYRPKTKWVADCGDPFYGVRYERFRKMFYFKYVERLFLKYCTYTSIPFGELVNCFESAFEAKFKVIPQGFKLDEITLSKEINSEKYPVIFFGGSNIPGLRDLHEFISYLLLKGKPFRFIIYTKQKELFYMYSEFLGKSIILMDYIPRKELIFEMSKADFLVNVDLKRIHGSVANAIPSKLIDYSISIRPILNYIHGEFDSKIADKFLEGNYDDSSSLDLDKYDIKTVASKFLEK